LHCFSNVIKELRKPFANNFNLLPMKNQIKSQCTHGHKEIGIEGDNMTIGVMSGERKESLNSLNVNEFEKLILTKYNSKEFKYIKRMD
jgi:hypothetical protein